MTLRLLVEATYPCDADALFALACRAAETEVALAGHRLAVEVLDPRSHILHATGDGPVLSLRRTVLPHESGAQWRDIVMVAGRVRMWRVRLALWRAHRRRGGRHITASAVAMLD